MFSDDIVLSKKSSSSNQYNDIIFLFIFILHLIIILTIAVTFGSVALSHIGSGTATLSNSGVLNYASPINRRESVVLILGSGVVIAVSIALSMSWIFFLSKFAAYFMTSLISSIIFLTIIFAGVAVSLNFTFVGVLMISFALLILISSLFFRPRIDFAAANLRVACAATLSCPSTLLSSAIIQLLQGFFTLVWAIAVYGVATNNDETIVQNLQKNLSFNINQCITYKYSGHLYIDEKLSLQCADNVDIVCQACVCGGKLLSDRACFNARVYSYGFICMLFSLIWTCGVCASVVQCSTATIVSKWWCRKLPLEDSAHSSIKEQEENGSGDLSWWKEFLSESGLQRSLTTSLGSLCFGSLLVAIVRIVRTLLRLFVRQTSESASLSSSSSSSSSSVSNQSARTCVGSILTLILKVMEKAMMYFNRYAFCYVGVHGYSFIKASKSVMALFRGKGWLNVLINDDITDFVITVSNFAIGIVTMFSGYYFAYFMGLTGVNLTLLTTLGFLAGYFTSRTTLSIISAAVSTVYICFAENPEIFKETHHDLYLLLYNTWAKVVPVESLSEGGKPDPVLDTEPPSRTIRGSYRPPQPAATSSEATAGGFLPASSSSDPDERFGLGFDNGGRRSGLVHPYGSDSGSGRDVHTAAASASLFHPVQFMRGFYDDLISRFANYRPVKQVDEIEKFITL